MLPSPEASSWTCRRAGGKPPGRAAESGTRSRCRSPRGGGIIPRRAVAPPPPPGSPLAGLAPRLWDTNQMRGLLVAAVLCGKSRIPRPRPRPYSPCSLLGAGSVPRYFLSQTVCALFGGGCREAWSLGDAHGLGGIGAGLGRRISFRAGC